MGYVDGRGEAPSDGANGGEYVDEEEVEDTMGTLTACGKTVPWGQKHIRHELSEDDDELMTYANLKALRHPILTHLSHHPF